MWYSPWRSWFSRSWDELGSQNTKAQTHKKKILRGLSCFSWENWKNSFLNNRKLDSPWSTVVENQAILGFQNLPCGDPQHWPPADHQAQPSCRVTTSCRVCRSASWFFFGMFLFGSQLQLVIFVIHEDLESLVVPDSFLIRRSLFTIFTSRNMEFKAEPSPGPRDAPQRTAAKNWFDGRGHQESKRHSLVMPTVFLHIIYTSYHIVIICYYTIHLQTIYILYTSSHYFILWIPQFWDAAPKKIYSDLCVKNQPSSTSARALRRGRFRRLRSSLEVQLEFWRGQVNVRGQHDHWIGFKAIFSPETPWNSGKTPWSTVEFPTNPMIIES